MRFKETFHVRLTEKQLEQLSKMAKRSKGTKADVIRHAIETVASEDHVVVPLSTKERLFIEGICDTAGVQPAEAVKMVLLSYHTLMSSPLCQIVKPVDEILEELEKSE